MKNLFLISLLLLSGSTTTFCQSKSAEDPKLKAHIIEIEKAGWNAFKTKDAAWFKANTTEGYLQITEEGITNRDEVIASLNDCTVKSFSFNDFSMVKLNKSTVLLIYTVSQDGMCGGEKLPAKVQVAVNYVKQGKKWLEAFYMDTPVGE
jgi:hypothetical protein